MASTTNPKIGPDPHRECACTPENLWLDIIITMDNSRTIGEKGLEKVCPNRYSYVHTKRVSRKVTLSCSTVSIQVLDLVSVVFQGITIGQGLKQQTRVGLISYASDATIIASISKYDTSNGFFNDLRSIKISSSPTVGLVK